MGLSDGASFNELETNPVFKVMLFFDADCLING